MRYLIIALLVLGLSFSIFAQKKFIFHKKENEKTEKSDDVKLTIKMLFKPANTSVVMPSKFTGGVDTVLSGYFFINEEPLSFGVGSSSDNGAKGLLGDSFLGLSSGNGNIYDSVLIKRKFDLKDISNEGKFSKIMFYRFNKKLLDSKPDSIALFFKYAVYDLLNHPGKFHYNFDVKLYHEMIIVPLNKVVLLKNISQNLFGSSLSIAITKTTKEERELYSKFTTRNFNQIFGSIKKNKVSNKKFNLGLEFVRSDKDNKNILLRQLEYPLESAMVLSDKNDEIPINLPIRIYKGEFRFPFIIMNNEKAEQYKDDELIKKFLKSNYNIFIVPMKYENNKLSINVFIEYDKIWGFYPNSIKKRLTIGKGEKLKLEIPNLKKTYKFNANKNSYEINTYEDYEKYVNEYIIIGFEYAE